MKPRKSFPLRLDPGLYEALERWAAQELRSVNGQIEYILRQAVTKHGRRAESQSPDQGHTEESDEPTGP